MKKPLILVGGGGHCISCIDVIRSTEMFEIMGILDIPEKIGELVLDIPVIASDDEISSLAKKNMYFFITIGQIKSAVKRVQIYQMIKAHGGQLPVIVSPRSYVSQSSKLGEGTIIMHNALINASAIIGKNCIINTGALIEHEADVGDFCHISTHSVVNGQSRIGDCSFIGSNSTIANNVTLSEKMIVSAGSCILRSPDQPDINRSY